MLHDVSQTKCLITHAKPAWAWQGTYLHELQHFARWHVHILLNMLRCTVSHKTDEPRGQAQGYLICLTHLTVLVMSSPPLPSLASPSSFSARFH